MAFVSLLLKFGVAPASCWKVTQSFRGVRTGSSRFYHAMGVPFADLLGLATIIVEIVGGLLILAGAFAPVAAVAMIVVLLVAIFTVHLPNGCSSIKLTSYDAAARTSARPICVAGAGPLLWMAI